MKSLRMALGAIDDRVYVGRVNKSGREWIDKQDMENDFLACAIEKFLDNETIINEDGKPAYKITVVRMEGKS